MRKTKIGAVGKTAAAAAVIGGLALNQRAGATPLNLTGVNFFSESNTLTASTYTNTNPAPGSVSFPHIISREFTNSGAYEIVPFIKVNLGTVPAGQQITGAQLGLFFTDSTYYGGAASRQEYIDLWSVKDAFDPASVNMTTYDSGPTHIWSDGFRAGVNHFLRTGPAGSFLSTVWPSGSAPAGTPSSKLNNGADEFKIWSADQLDNYLTAQHLAGKDAYFELTNSNAAGNAYRFVATGDANGATFGVHYDAAHQPFLSFDASPLVYKWRLNDSGGWETANDWFAHAIPNAADTQVVFGSWTDVAGTVYPQGSIAVTVGSAKTVGHVTFDTPETYNITGTNPLTLDVSSGSATIDVLNGTQVISAPLMLNKNTTVTVAASAPSLTVSGNLTAAAGVTLAKAGGGILEVKNIRMSGVAVSGGTLVVTANGSAAGTSRVATVAVSGGGRLDLSDNDLVVTSTPIGTLNGSTYDGVTGLIQSGRNGGGWTGSGIVTSQSGATGGNFTSIGVASASQAKGIAATATAVWSGQSVTGSNTLVMYTYGGDANLDGQINVDDYGRIDFNVNLGSSGWYNGDFNYDGKVNVDDYGIIDFNVGIQGPPLGNAAGPGAVGAVPEPSGAGLFAATMCTLIARRRRRCRR